MFIRGNIKVNLVFYSSLLVCLFIVELRPLILISYVLQSHVLGNFHIEMKMVVSYGVRKQEMNQKLLQ